MIFNYTARDKEGKIRKGFVEASSKEQAVEILRSRELIPTGIKEKSSFTLADLFSSIRGVSETEKTIFTRQLATMVGAGLPLARALEILVGQTKNPRFREVLAASLRDVRSGAALSSTLEKYPDIFPPVYISLIRAGEASGSLDNILLRLADNMERRHEFIGRTRGALIYPSIVIIGMVIVFIIMMTFVIPKLTTMYRDLGATLPLPTRIMIAISDLMTGFWWVFLLLIGGGLVFLWRFSQTSFGRSYLARLAMRLPVFGPIVTLSQLTELSRTLALLVSSGVPILSSLSIAKGSVGNVLYQEAMERISRAVEKGAPMSKAFQNERVFPPAISQMIAVGEETGKVDEVLLKISDSFEGEVNQAMRNISSAIEPLIMVILGVLVAFLILAVILPIYSLTSQL